MSAPVSGWRGHRIPFASKPGSRSAADIRPVSKSTLAAMPPADQLSTRFDRLVPKRWATSAMKKSPALWSQAVSTRTVLTEGA